MYVIHTLLPAKLITCTAIAHTGGTHKGGKESNSSLRNKPLFSEQYMLCYLSLK